MASGHVNRANRPNTWLHRPMLQREKALANTEPSTHGPSLPRANATACPQVAKADAASVGQLTETCLGGLVVTIYSRNEALAPLIQKLQLDNEILAEQDQGERPPTEAASVRLYSGH
jgi:hypothetical protein